MQVNIAIEVDTATLAHVDDQRLAALWHLAQANHAPFGDPVACDFAEQVGREIIRRFLVATPPALWNHQGRHVKDHQRINAAGGSQRSVGGQS